MSTILDKLNEEQREPAVNTEGPVLVTAGAGSGKTRLLTHRIAHLVQDKGVFPYNILAITFTNKAASEMKERLGALVDNVQDMWICTFHAMCSKILRVHAREVGLSSNFSIYGDAEKDRVVKRLLAQDAEFLALEKNKLKLDTVCWHISNAKNELISPTDYAEKIAGEKYGAIIARAYISYQKELLNSNAVDFDDLLVKVYELFKDCPSVLEAYQNRFKYIHVDEFQDTNEVQYKLVLMLGKSHKNIFVVGDEDQCIYSWRGAKFTNVQKFIDDHSPDIKIFKLEQNYRSTASILNVANEIIKNNRNRLEKQLWTENEGGEKINYYSPYNDLEEAEYVAMNIKKLVTEEGYSYRDFAVLMRINSLSRVVEEKFLNYQIPYDVYGGFKFFERKEVKDTLSYLKLIGNNKDNDSFVRAISFPKKGIGDASIEKILRASTDTGLSAYEVAKTGTGIEPSLAKKLAPIMANFELVNAEKDNMSISSIMTRLIDLFGIKSAFSRSVEEELSKIMNIETLEKSIIEFEEANDDASIENYLQSITLSRDIDDMNEEDNHVSVMTIHSAKGLEFKVVYVIGCVEGVLPLSRAVNSADPNELEEERRLMYVAVTRAKEKLTLTRPSSRFSFETRRTEGTVESRFIKEAGLIRSLEPKRRAENEDYSFERGSRNFAFGGGYTRTGNSSGYSSFDDDEIVEEKPRETISKDKIDLYKSFKLGTRVFHKSFGEGVVTVEVSDFVGAFVTIRFETVGVKTLSLKFAPLTILD